MSDSAQATIQIAHLGREGGDPGGMSALAAAFAVGIRKVAKTYQEMGI